MHKSVLCLVVAAVLIVPVTAAVTVPNLGNATQEDIQSSITAYNENTDAIPGVLAMLIRDQRVNVNVSSPDGPIVHGVVLDGLMIADHAEGGVADPTLTVYTSTATLEAIARAEDSRKAALTAFTSGEIDYEVRGFVNTVKFGVLRALIHLYAAVS